MSERHRHPRSVRRRAIGRAGAVSLLSLVLVASLVPAGQAQDRADLSAEAVGSTADASAVVAEFVPAVGGVNFAVATGVALARVTNKVAVAQAKSLDLGLVGLVISAFDIVPGSELPQPLTVDNREGDQERDETDRPVVGGQLGAGRKRVRATRPPGALAQADVVSSVGDLLSIDGGHAEAATRELEPGTRQARSSVSVDLHIAGIVELSGLRWEASHRSGNEPHATGTFEVARAAIGGVPVPTESLVGLGEAVNAALAPTGLAVRLPRVERTSVGSDIVRVTPLEVEMRDTPVGQAALGPVMELSRPQREQLFDEVNSRYGAAGIALLVTDIALSIAGGQGSVTARIGGAQASSGDLVVDDPFGDVASPTVAPEVPPGGVVTPPLDAGAGTGVRGPGTRGPSPVETARHCESEHERAPRPCSGGSLLPLGVGIAVAGTGLGLADWRRSRRRGAIAAGAAVPATARRHRWRPGVLAYVPLVGAGLAFVVLGAGGSVPRASVDYRPPVAVPSVGRAGGPAPSEGAAGPAAGGRSTVGRAGERATGRTTACLDRTRQVPGDPYSPPCYAFSGDNGGATAPGVTGDTIRVSVRQVEAGSATDIFTGLAGQSIQDTTESVTATIEALAEYFSERFELYGRKLEILPFRGQGNGLNELLGGGKEAAAADAVRAAEELRPFADISGNTLPYADGLARHQVVNVGAPYPSRAWFVARRPYAWSLFPDGTNVVEASTSAIVGRYPPGSAAEHAGGPVRGRPRRFAVVAPENAEYQESVNVLLDRLKAAGIDVAVNIKYKLDLQSMPNQASNAIAKLKDLGVTSVLCYCDPAMLAFGMTPKANEQQYEPEWITAGLVFVDQDVVSQAIDRRQWAHAFGTAYNAESERIGGSFPYAAYKSVRPDDEPSLGVEELYYQMYLLVLGIQMAGPDLTPESFEAGLFAYPGAFGPRGTWGFGSGDYTPTNDYRELWWDPDRISTQNDKPGTWVQLADGKRWSPQNPPRGRAPFFEEG